jgi:hypothetical protein
VPRRRRQQTVEPPDDEIGRAVYGHLITEPARFPWEGLQWEPVRIGPTWQTKGKRKRWLLPERTLGWHALGWSAQWLHNGQDPWIFTDEQARFLLWWYAIDKAGRFLYRDGVLQRLKGWGKDPVGACICFIEAFGPCRFAGWDDEGQPIAADVPSAWVQTAAVALDQTKNTTRFFPVLAGRVKPRSPIRVRYGLQVGKTLVHGLGDTRLIEAVTSSPSTLEGARSTFLLLNETHHWTDSNEGREMADVIERNATKSPDGAARTLAITNAYEPSEESVAQLTKEAWEKAEAGASLTTGLLYDSLEAPPEAPLDPEIAPDVVAAVRGDSHWLDIPRIVQSILDTRNPPSRSRRFWYNQDEATEDAWVAPREWDSAADPSFEPQPNDVITLGFDGSLTDDDTALIACHVERDHLFSLGIWSPPKDGEVDRAAIDRAVRAAFELYDVVGFYADLHPWESYVDTWAEEFGGELLVKASVRQPVAWDMRSREKQFTEACERLLAAVIESGQGTDPRLTHDGSQRFRIHAKNARRKPNRWGVSVRKEHRESARKIDAVPAAVLARLGRMDYVALPASRRRKKRSGRVW